MRKFAEKMPSIEHGVTQAKTLDEEISIRKSFGMLFCISANLRAGIAPAVLRIQQVDV